MEPCKTELGKESNLQDELSVKGRYGNELLLLDKSEDVITIVEKFFVFLGKLDGILLVA